jgi:hypothetical protein
MWRVAPFVTDQGSTSVCVGHALAAAACIEFRMHVDPGTPDMSFLFGYALGRRLEHPTQDWGGVELVDEGSMPRLVCKALQKWGLPPRTTWTGDDKLNSDPDLYAFLSAVKYRVANYSAIYEQPGMRRSNTVAEVLAQGHPVCFSLVVSAEIDQWWGEPLSKTMPARNYTLPVRGSHYVCLVGYRIIGGEMEFLMRNSWGTQWGDEGYAWVAEGWVNDLASRDFRFVEVQR